MDYTKWYNKYCVDCDLKYNSDNTRSTYKSCVSLFLNRFKKVDQPQRIANDDNNVKTTMIYTHISDSLILKINSLINLIRLYC